MEDSLTIVLEDKSTLTDICGPNDSNLRMLERLLGVKIHTKGNELAFFGGPNLNPELCKKILEGIIRKKRNGSEVTQDLITGLFLSLNDEQDEKATEFDPGNGINIPGAGKTVFPRTANQSLLLKEIAKKDIVFAIGPAGTGKTFLAIAYGLYEILFRKKKKILLTRPIVEAGENLGFLPGDFAQKIAPYLRPLYDSMEAILNPETLLKMEENKLIEIAPLAYMRGRSLNQCFVILDEAQNATKEQMKMFLTRMGEGTKMVITGDVTQIDLPKPGKSGLIHAKSLLSGIPDIGFVNLTKNDVVRHHLVKKIIEAYDSEKKNDE
jgi:phosphate starvation-inducible PhoH-like protein